MTTFADIENGKLFTIPSRRVLRQGKKPEICRKVSKTEYFALNRRNRKRKLSYDTIVEPFSLADPNEVPEEEITVKYKKINRDDQEQEQEVCSGSSD